MSNARLLYRLQQIDQEIDATRQAVAAAQGRQGESPELVAARDVLAAAQARLAAARAAQTEYEDALQKNLAKLADVQEQMYSGRVKNPKELAGLEKDVASLGRRRDEIQDKVLEAMLEVEAAREAHSTAQAALALAEAGWQANLGRSGQELAEAQKRTAQLARDRADTLARLDPKEIELYQDLRRRKGPAPVARLRGSTCGRCGVTLPVTIAGQVRHGDELVFCPSCGRLLVTE